MTRVLSDHEVRAELRAHYPRGGTLMIDEHMNAVLDALDAAHATIESLTAPVTAAEAAISADAYMNGGKPMHDVLDAFIARRKEQAP